MSKKSLSEMVAPYLEGKAIPININTVSDMAKCIRELIKEIERLTSGCYEVIDISKPELGFRWKARDDKAT